MAIGKIQYIKYCHSKKVLHDIICPLIKKLLFTLRLKKKNHCKTKRLICSEFKTEISLIGNVIAVLY